MNLGNSDLVAGPKPSAVTVGLPSKKLAQPESAQNKSSVEGQNAHPTASAAFVGSAQRKAVGVGYSQKVELRFEGAHKVQIDAASHE